MEKPVLTAVAILLHLLSPPHVLPIPPAARSLTHVLYFAGIPEGNVHAVTGCSIREMQLRGEPDPSGGLKTGVLRGEVHLSCSPEAGMKLVVEIRPPGQEKAPAVTLRRVYAVKDSVVSFTLPVTGIRLWSAETPLLYDVQVHLTDSSGHSSDVVTQKTGFRKIVADKDALLVNDRRVRIRGLRLRDVPAGGQALSRESMLQWVRLMKQYNINALRLPAPIDPCWSALGDQYGLYIVDEGCCQWQQDSVFTADGRPLPAAGEMKQRYQPVLTTLPVAVKGLPGVGIKVSNEQTFRDLSYLYLEWQMLVNGVPVQRGTVPALTIAAGQSGTVRLPVKLPAGLSEVFLNIGYKLKKAEGLLPAGSVVASGQLLLRADPAIDLSVHPAGELTFTDEGGAFTISALPSGLNVQFNKQTGLLQHFVIGGRSLLEDSLGLSPGLWNEPAREPKLQLFSTSTAIDIVVVRADYQIPETFCALHVHYTVNAKGEMQVEQVLEVDSAQLSAAGDTFPRPLLPRFGMRWSLPAGYDSIAYYGPGLQEQAVGIYRQMVDQPSGVRTGIRWWKIIGGQGHGMQLTADSSQLSIGATRLADGAKTRLNIDQRLDAPYGNYHYIFKMTPF